MNEFFISKDKKPFTLKKLISFHNIGRRSHVIGQYIIFNEIYNRLACLQKF